MSDIINYEEAKEYKVLKKGNPAWCIGEKWEKGHPACVACVAELLCKRMMLDASEQIIAAARAARAARQEQLLTPTEIAERVPVTTSEGLVTVETQVDAEFLRLPRVFTQLEEGILDLNHVAAKRGKRIINYHFEGNKFLSIPAPINPETLLVVFYTITKDEFKRTHGMIWTGLDNRPELPAMYVKPYEIERALDLIKLAYTVVVPKIRVFVQQQRKK